MTITAIAPEKKQRRKLSLADRIAEIDAKIKRLADAQRQLYAKRQWFIKEAREKAEAAMAEVEKHGGKPVEVSE